MRVDGETLDMGPGNVVIIIPGQRHKVRQEREGDMVMLVTCVPAYSVEEVAFDKRPDGQGGLPERGKPGRRD